MPDGECEKTARLPLLVRDASPDCWSDVRNLHATALRQLRSPTLDADQVTAFLGNIYSPDYTSTLQSQSLLTAWYDDELVATSGWLPADDSGMSARITAVFVSPLYTRMGVGRRMVRAIERKAGAAGFQSFSARVLPPALPFFEAMGYQRSSLGVFTVGTEYGIPIVFMRKGKPPPLSTAGCTEERAG